MNIIKFDDNNPSTIPEEDLQSLYNFVEDNILKKNNQPYLKYTDWMTIKALLDVLKFEDDQGQPWFVWIKRKTSLDYLTSIQEKCYDRRYEYKKISSLFDRKKTLDVGCKYWDMSLYINWEYTWLDINKDAIDEAEKIGRWKFIVGDFLTYNIDDKFDIVILSHILEHYEFNDCLSFLEKAFNYADSIFVSIPQWFERKKWHKQTWNSRESFEKLFWNVYNVERLETTEVFSHNYLFTKKQ